mmetsp:Transcript_14048/g.42489  ORF Transcript_14048/g.42489 Transcript_14048/m.42489 type:complete len:267 (-) Transcript_14048:290-1090(-)
MRDVVAAPPKARTCAEKELPAVPTKARADARRKRSRSGPATEAFGLARPECARSSLPRATTRCGSSAWMPSTRAWSSDATNHGLSSSSRSAAAQARKRETTARQQRRSSQDSSRAAAGRFRRRCSRREATYFSSANSRFVRRCSPAPSTAAPRAFESSSSKAAVFEKSALAAQTSRPLTSSSSSNRQAWPSRAAVTSAFQPASTTCPVAPAGNRLSGVGNCASNCAALRGIRSTRLFFSRVNSNRDHSWGSHRTTLGRRREAAGSS